VVCVSATARRHCAAPHCARGCRHDKVQRRRNATAAASPLAMPLSAFVAMGRSAWKVLGVLSSEDMSAMEAAVVAMGGADDVRLACARASCLLYCLRCPPL
jgi:hypothetical protein